jgi:hypothetical protein
MLIGELTGGRFLTRTAVIQHLSLPLCGARCIYRRQRSDPDQGLQRRNEAKQFAASPIHSLIGLDYPLPPR